MLGNKRKHSECDPITKEVKYVSIASLVFNDFITLTNLPCDKQEKPDILKNLPQDNDFTYKKIDAD